MNLNFRLLISILISFLAYNVSFAQTQNTGIMPATETVKPVQEVKKQESQPPPPVKDTSACNCQKPVLDIIDKAYLSLEEDEWSNAIKVCTDAVNTVKNLAVTCTCLDVPLYKGIAQAFLNYAKGGDILDGEKEPDCTLANKLYTDAIKSLEESIPKIKDVKLKTNVESIRDYCKEELEFVKDECSG